jgi:hypothetical protein
MAKPRNTNDGDAAADAPDEFAALQELAVSGATARLYRVVNGKYEYLETIGADEISPEWVKATHGGGSYQARGRGANGEMSKTVTFRIAGAPKIALDAPAAAAAAQPGPALSSTERLLTELLAELRAGARAAPAPPPDPIATTVAMMTAVATMMKELKPESSAAAGLSVKDALELMNQGIQIGQGREPAESGGGGTALLASVIPQLVELARERHGQQVALPAPNPQPQPGAVTVSPSPLQKLGAMVPALIQYAQQNRDPFVYASVLIDEHPADIAQLRAAVDAHGLDTVFNQLLAHFPAISQHREWFTDLLKELTSPEEDEHAAG